MQFLRGRRILRKRYRGVMAPEHRLEGGSKGVGSTVFASTSSPFICTPESVTIFGAWGPSKMVPRHWMVHSPYKWLALIPYLGRDRAKADLLGQRPNLNPHAICYESIIARHRKIPPAIHGHSAYALFSDYYSLGLSIELLKSPFKRNYDTLRTVHPRRLQGRPWGGRVDLGEVEGALSIMILRPIGSKMSSKTYIVDIAQLPVDTLTPLFDLLRADAPVKVVFDGRKDFCELHHTYGVTLGKTVDMQIAEIRLRVLQGQSPLEQVRLYPVWLRSRAISRPSDYVDVHNIISLDHCAKKLGLIYSDKAKVDHSLWLQRPLNVQYLQYAAYDAYLIELIYGEFERRGILGRELEEISQRYVSVWSDEKPRRSDIYRQHPLLPLNILAYSPVTNVDRRCAGCQRLLPGNCFTSASLKERKCLVCYVLRWKPVYRRF
ncbi:hypothetical protein AB1N83_001916 [Pleurotus pulmonarius]